MGGINPLNILKAPKTPKVSVPEQPTEEEKNKSVSDAQEEEKRRRAAQGGRAATILTSGRGVVGDDTGGLATKRLLGG
jgi:hypothetical protein